MIYKEIEVNSNGILETIITVYSTNEIFIEQPPTITIFNIFEDFARKNLKIVENFKNFPNKQIQKMGIGSAIFRQLELLGCEL